SRSLGSSTPASRGRLPGTPILLASWKTACLRRTTRDDISVGHRLIGPFVLRQTPLQHGCPAATRPEPVGNLTIFLEIKDRQICVLVDLDRALALCESQRVCTVDGGRDNCLLHIQLHLCTCDRQDHWHAGRRRCAGIVVGGQGHSYSSID